MPGGDFLILMLLQWIFIGRETGAERVTGVLHGQVELRWHHGNCSNTESVEWVKYKNESSHETQLIYRFVNTSSAMCPNPENVSFDPQKMSLTLHNLREKDEGFYSEITIFTNGSKKMINITLSLLFASKIAVSFSNGTLTLTCEVRGEFVLLRWMRGSLSLPDDQRFSFSEKNKTVQVSNLMSLDCSTYTCRVVNKDGASHEAHVNITGEITAVCQNKKAFNILIFAGVVFIAVLLVCLILSVCICKYDCRRMDPSDRSRRGCCRLSFVEVVHYEPTFVQEAANQTVSSLPYVYSSFIKPRAPQQTDQGEDFGYSTIAELTYENTQSSQTTCLQRSRFGPCANNTQ